MTPPIGRLHVLTDETLQSRFGHAELAGLAARGGADRIQLREKRHWSTRQWLAVADAATRAIREARGENGAPGSRLIVNDRVDIAAAVASFGVHLGADDMPAADARKILGPGAVIGATANDRETAVALCAEPIDYLGVGPVFGTTSKSAPAKRLDPDGLARIVDAVSLPVVAIGSIDAARIDEVLGAGAHGVAVLSAVVAAADPAQATARIREAIDAALKRRKVAGPTRHRPRRGRHRRGSDRPGDRLRARQAWPTGRGAGAQPDRPWLDPRGGGHARAGLRGRSRTAGTDRVRHGEPRALSLLRRRDREAFGDSLSSSPRRRPVGRDDSRRSRRARSPRRQPGPEGAGPQGADRRSAAGPRAAPVQPGARRSAGREGPAGRSPRSRPGPRRGGTGPRCRVQHRGDRRAGRTVRIPGRPVRSTARRPVHHPGSGCRRRRRSLERAGLHPALDRAGVRPVKGQIVRLRGPVLLQQVVRTPDVYLIPRSGGELLVGATMEEMGFGDRPTGGAVMDLLRHGWQVLPGIYDLEFVEVAVGLRPAVRDHLPAIGPTAVQGLWAAFGHYRNGVLLAPATAHHLAEWITTGQAPVELAPFSPARLDLPPSTPRPAATRTGVVQPEESA